jgi:hypothetical protein
LVDSENERKASVIELPDLGVRNFDNSKPMLSLVRLARSPRALVTVPHTHIRHFASEVPTNLPALYPGPSKKKAKAKKVERALDVHPQPAPEDVPEPEPESQPRAQSQSQAHETSEDFVPIEEDPDHPDNRPIRPPHGIKIDRENHGLSGFFRKFQNAEGAWDWAIVEQKAEGGYSGGYSWSHCHLSVLVFVLA